MELAKALTKDAVAPCPDCEDGHLKLKRNSKTGEAFWSCSNYDCKYTGKYDLQGLFRHVESHLNARCGDWWLPDARTVDIQRILDQIAREDCLSKTSLKHIKHFLSGIYKFAAQQGLFERANPVTAASIPDAPWAERNLRLFA